MLSKENIRKQVADNQMGYVAAESTIVDYEDRLSSEELQLERSQWSPRVTRSSSISSSCTWHSISSDDEMTTNGISLANDEIEKRATFFVKTFVRKFEEELSKLSKEAKPGSKTRKPGKTLDYINSTVNDFTPPGPLRLGLNKMNECIGFFSAREHRKDAKRISATIAFLEDKMRKILVETGLEIFQSFEEQMTKVIDDSWERGIEKLAMDAVSRAINYISEPDKKGEFHIPDIIKGVVLGGSKRKHLFTTRSGHQVKDKQSGEILMTSELYEKVGIEKREGKTTKYYQLREHGYAEKYGYRLPFIWEVEEWEKVEQKYVLSEISKKRYAYILDEEKKKGLASSILKEINGNDPTKKKDIEELREEIKNLRIHHQKEGKNTFSFDLGCLPEFFIKREIMLGELKEKLSSKNQEEEMSRMVLINGEYGTGKSELARSYRYNKGEDSNVWTNVIWIDARTYGTLLDSFRSLAERLKIPTKNGQEINADMEVKEQQKREIKSIVKDIYQYFRDVKSLFIFDNASEYKEIEKFLPSHFSDLFFGKEKPYVLITSRSKSWKKEIEKIELDDGFFPEEAIAFIRKILKVKDRSQDCYLVELAQALGYLPLALAQATAYIKQEKISIIKYLEHYDKAMKESNLDYFEVQGIPPELFTTLKVNFNKIRREKNIGQQSNDIVAYMAYLSPNQINIKEIFLQKKSEKDKQQILDALDRLHKFSVIELEESIAKVHNGVQKTVRVEKERAGTEEETLREIMTSFCVTSTNHIISIWSHASKYSKLVNEFIDFTYDGGTVLHLLAKYDNKKVIKLILEKIDPKKLSEVINVVDEEDLTALDYAAMYGHLEIVKYFIDNGYFKLDKLIEENNATLYYAVKHGHLDIVKYFIEKLYSMNLHDLGDISPIHFAAESGHLDIVKYLIEKGISVNLQDLDGMSSVHWAAKDGHLDIVKYLAEKGGNIDLRDKCGMRPVCYAIVNGNLDIAEYLLEQGANMNLKNNYIILLWTALLSLVT